MLFEHDKIIKSLNRRVSNYEPFFWEDGEDRLITCELGEGFLAVVRLRQEAWQPLRQGAAQTLYAMLSVLFQDEKIDAKLIEMGVDPEELFEVVWAELSDLVSALYGIRKEQLAGLSPSPRLAKKIRRNDPCPCGSGKKYKKCCLN